MNEKEKRRIAKAIKRIQPYLEEKVLAACAFERLHWLPLWEGGQWKETDYLGRKLVKKRAGGLPEMGWLALTSAHVYPYTFKLGFRADRGVNLHAAWGREAMQVIEWHHLVPGKKVTLLFCPANVPEVHLAFAPGNPGMREEFIRLLREPGSSPTLPAD
jgi:hypothetical protein